MGVKLIELNSLVLVTSCPRTLLVLIRTVAKQKKYVVLLQLRTLCFLLFTTTKWWFTKRQAGSITVKRERKGRELPEKKALVS